MTSVARPAVIVAHPSAPPVALIDPQEYFAMSQPFVPPPADPREQPVVDKYAQTTASKVASKIAQYHERIAVLTRADDDGERERLLALFRDELPVRDRDVWDDVRDAYASMDEPEKLGMCHDLQRALDRARQSSVKRCASRLLEIKLLSWRQ